MSFFDALKGELIDIIEWTDDSRDTIVWRFPRYDNEIKMGAKLVVRESQIAVFVNEGRIADVFAPGTYTLETKNIPILSTLKGWKHGFSSPFKAEVYFVNVRQFTDFKWGTKNPVMLRDPEFGAVRVRAFGGFSARVVDPPLFLTELVGTDPQFRTEEVENYLRQMVVSRLGNALATAAKDIPVLDLASHQDDLGRDLAGRLSRDMASVGLEIPNFNIENISLPPRWRRRWTSAPRWASSATWTATAGSRPPTPWRRPPGPRAAAWARPWAWGWAWAWPSRWRSRTRSPELLRSSPPPHSSSRRPRPRRLPCPRRSSGTSV
ncbi:SPFH domain-containing protein [Nocardiopsis alba]|uniref:SPFH domain-containing protein n=1 Tax=Nocardiopsis alba TaxID=53437 RepID=UPI001F2C5E2E|nr:SPFH domain-containing protein [Nocardiopsis alba]